MAFHSGERPIGLIDLIIHGVSFEVILAERKAAVPVGEFAQLQEIAAAAAFLASDESRHMTGAQLIVDGGIAACDTYYNTGLTDRE